MAQLVARLSGGQEAVSSSLATPTKNDLSGSGRFFIKDKVMRIRRKKHLKERLLSVDKYILPTDRRVINVNEALKEKQYFNYQEIFSNANPVKLEIGCGKGGFICDMALAHPEYNYIAVELLDNIIVMASERADKLNLSNVRFVNSGAEYLAKYICDNSIEQIYLNFSPPFPQESYRKRRLTYDRNIENYKKFLVRGGTIVQKTDDKEFFEYSFAQFKRFGFEVVNISQDIEQGKIENITTEYERKFKNAGMPIYALVAKIIK